MPAERTSEGDSASGIGWMQSDEQLLACDQITCLNLAHRVCLYLSLQVANCWIELLGESGPFVRGARTHARNLRGVIEETRQRWKEKIKLRKAIGAPTELDPILIHRLPELLRGLDRDVYAPLSQIREDESSAAAKIRSLCDTIERYSAEARRCVVETEEMVRRHFAATVSASLREGRERCEECTVISVDLCEYGRLARIIEEITEVQQLFFFDGLIRELLSRCLREVGLTPENTICKDGGDGAIFLLFSPEIAVRFAEAVMRAVAEKNQRIVHHEHRWFFRIGIATGMTCRAETRAPDGSLIRLRATGVAIARSVRLQAAAEPNSIVIGAQTWGRLPTDLQERFLPCEEIPAKSHEPRIPGHRSAPPVIS